MNKAAINPDEYCASAKIFASKTIIVESMKNNSIKKLKVHKVLSSYPESIKVFIQYSPECIGCAFEHFCTVEDVARVYGISLQEWINVLEEAINPPDKRSSL